MARCCQSVKSPTNKTLVASGSLIRKVCLLRVVAFLAIYHCPFQNPFFGVNRIGLASGRLPTSASRTESSQREANRVIFSTVTSLPYEPSGSKPKKQPVRTDQ